MVICFLPADNAAEQQRRDAETLAQRRQLQEVIRRVSEFTADTLKQELGNDAADQDFLERWAERIVSLGKLLSAGGLVARLDQLPAAGDAKEYAIQILKLGCAAQSDRIVRLLADAENLSQPPAPSFSGWVNYWLRHGVPQELLASVAGLDTPKIDGCPAPPAPLEGGGGIARVATADRKSRKAANVWRKQGEIWTIRFDGKKVHVKDVIGLGYLAELLSKPGRALSAAELVAAGRPLPVASGGMDVIDKQARDAFRDRFEEVTSELAEAEENNDPARIEKLQHERYALAEQLEAATGLGGRVRQLGDQGERPRKSVGMAISRSIDSLEKAHPDLARHLLKSVRMGRDLSYMPGADVSWEF